MKKQYIEAAILSIIYLVISGVILSHFNVTEGPLSILLYPAKICLEPIFEQEFSIEKLNIGLFGLYFLWSFNCVYLNVIKSTLKHLSWK